MLWKLKGTRGLWAAEVASAASVRGIEWLRDTVFQVHIQGRDRAVRIGRSSEGPARLFTAESAQAESAQAVSAQAVSAQARCEASMRLLDAEHRAFVTDYRFDEDILAIKAVAGSGKTTTLLNLCAKNPGKRVLYIAFNKALIDDIRAKAADRGLRNVKPMTFDALVYQEAVARRATTASRAPSTVTSSTQTSSTGTSSTGTSSTIDQDMMAMGFPTLEIVDLKPHSLGRALPWLEDKPWAVKDHYVRAFGDFCRQTRYREPGPMAPGKPLLEAMWKETRAGRLNTFAGLRKLAQVDHWFRGRLSADYDCVFIDEAQDFDPIMLDILLMDAGIPKIFVGDPMQEIYGWRGCINAFARLPPSTTLTVEFYTTFRMGNPACRAICGLFPGSTCRMIPGGCSAQRESHLHAPVWGQAMKAPDPEQKRVWLFRTWRCLLEEAARVGEKKEIWIHGFAAQMTLMRALHRKLSKCKRSLTKAEEDEFSDDLPRYLLSLSHADLENLIAAIEGNLAPDAASARVVMYTIHAYKGLEDDVVVVYNDIDPVKDEKLLYVAVTRGRREIFLEPRKLPPARGHSASARASAAAATSKITRFFGQDE